MVVQRTVVKIGLVISAITFIIASIGFLIPSLSQTIVLDPNQAGTENFKLTYDVITEDTSGTGIIYTPQCFECHLPINFSYSGTDAPDSLNLPISKFAHTLNKLNLNDDISVVAITLLTNQTYSETIDNVTKTCVDKIAVNGTNYTECTHMNSPYHIQKWRWGWISLSDSMTLEKNKWYAIDFIARRSSTLGNYATDLIPSINSVELSDLAWFNSSYSYRTNFTVKVPSSTIVGISADTKVVVPINFDTHALIATNKLNSDGSDLTIVDQSNVLLNWTWCDYTSPNIGINTSNTCLVVQHTVKTDNSSIISLYYGNVGDTIFDNTTFNKTFSYADDSLYPMIVVIGGSKGAYISEKTGSGAYFTKNNGNDLTNVTGRNVKEVVNATDATRFVNALTTPICEACDYTFMTWFKTPLGSSNQVLWDGDQLGGADGGTWIQINGGITCNGGGSTSYNIQADKWYFFSCKGPGSASQPIRYMLFNDTNFIELAAPTSYQDSSEAASPRLFHASANFNGPLELLLVYRGEVSNNIVNATWAMWSNHSLVIKQDEEDNIASETGARSAIRSGILQSVISGAPMYENQTVYFRYLNGSIANSTFDMATSNGTKRWAFNFIAGTDIFANMGNMSVAVYTKEMEDMTTGEIKDAVSSFINQTNS